MNKDLTQLEEAIDYRFKDLSLLKHAMIHSSYQGEMQWQKEASNERLEFLGDAVLELCISDELYHKYPHEAEGELTRKRSSLVFEAALNVCARDISLGEYIYLGKGEDMCGGREKPSILSDAFEALIGAIYLDGGLESARRFIREHIVSDIDELELLKDGKTALQQYVQQMNDARLRYETEDFSGPQHNRVFKSKVFVNNTMISEGTGHSKKTAEQQAALVALKKLKADK